MGSKPQALFGAPEAASTAWLGYVLALAAGTASGGTFIAARKSKDVNPLVMTTCVCLLEGTTMWFIFLAGIAKDPPLSTISQAPGVAAAVFVALLVIVTVA